MRRFSAVASAALLMCLAIPQASADNTVNLSDSTAQFDMRIPWCSTSTELDCVESIVVDHADGTTETPTLLSADPEASNVDSSGKLVRNSGYTMRYHSGSLTGPDKEFRLVPQLRSPLPEWGKLDVAVFADHSDTDAFHCDGYTPAFCKYFTLDPADTFRIVARTSWVWPNDAQAEGRRGDIAMEPFGSGHRWTFTGGQTILASVSPSEWNAVIQNGAEFKASNMSTSLVWRLHHAATPEHSAFGATALCATKGYALRSGNGAAAGTPFWDATTSTLNFSLYSAHLDTNGELFQGFFYTRLPRAYLDCAFPGNTLAHASQVRVTVEYLASGEPQVVVSGTKVDKDYIYVYVPSFHFSTPTVRVENADVAVPAVTPSPTATPVPSVTSSPSSAPSPTVTKKPVSKSTTITCVKGKSTKKVTAVNPKCPTGWKKK